jgi:DNA-binding winged helix-turn-helix (wHTH) protein
VADETMMLNLSHRRELRRGDAVIAMQPQVFDLLEYLITSIQAAVC